MDKLLRPTRKNGTANVAVKDALPRAERMMRFSRNFVKKGELVNARGVMRTQLVSCRGLGSVMIAELS